MVNHQRPSLSVRWRIQGALVCCLVVAIGCAHYDTNSEPQLVTAPPGAPPLRCGAGAALFTYSPVKGDVAVLIQVTNTGTCTMKVAVDGRGNDDHDFEVPALRF